MESKFVNDQQSVTVSSPSCHFCQSNQAILFTYSGFQIPLRGKNQFFQVFSLKITAFFIRFELFLFPVFYDARCKVTQFQVS